MKLSVIAVAELLTDLGLKRFVAPALLIALPALLPGGDWAQLRLMLMFISVLVGAVWAFALVLSSKGGKGVLPELDLHELLEEAKKSPVGASIVAAAFLLLLACFILAVAYMVK